MGRTRSRPWVSTATAVLTGLLAVFTAIVPDWLELAGFDPDQRSGALEWCLVAVLAAVAVMSGAFAGSRWRRRLAAP